MCSFEWVNIQRCDPEYFLAHPPATHSVCYAHHELVGTGTHAIPSSAVWFNGSVPDVTPFATGPYGGNPGMICTPGGTLSAGTLGCTL